MISVIVPVYNAEKYIRTCVQSILEQDYSDFEILLIDDGSKDSSGLICDELQKKNGKLAVYHTENHGAAAARNYGIARANGEWIAFVDSDDVIAKNYLGFLMGLAEKNQADLAICGYRKVYGNHDVAKTSTNFNLQVLTGEDAMESLLYQRNFMSVPWGMISKKDIWKKVQFPEGTRAEDMGTIYRLFVNAKKVAYADEKLYDYYQRPDNTIYTTGSVRNIDYYKHSKDMLAFVSANYPAKRRSAESRHFSTCFQILSETARVPENKELLQKVYADIRMLRGNVRKDKNAKMRNRGAAILSYVSISMLHRLLRLYDRKQRKKL